MKTPMLSRRHALMAAAALPVVPALSAAAVPTAARAQEAAPPATGPVFNRFRIGAFEVTTLLVGTRILDNPQETFGLNASPEAFADWSAANFIPADRARNSFTPTLVNNGESLILFDTGLSSAATNAVLAAAGHAPEDIDVVVITHMHGDHIGGLMTDGAPTYANAGYVTGQVEFDHWAAAGNDGFEANVRPLAERFTFLGDGGTAAAGVTAMAAFGHSPGHMTYMIESEGQQLALIADAANHYVWSVGRPDWEVRFDMDKPAAAATRKRLLGMIAADRIPFVGYHMPFPAVGYLEPRDAGFRYVPAAYQLSLEG